MLFFHNYNNNHYYNHDVTLAVTLLNAVALVHHQPFH